MSKLNLSLLRTFTRWAVLSWLFIYLTACVHPLYEQADENIHRTANAMNEAKQKYSRPMRAKGKLGAYAKAQKYLHTDNPEWQHRFVEIHGNEMPFSFIASKIVSRRHVLLTYSEDINPEKLITMHYRGEIKGALDVLQAKSGYGYTIDNNKLAWSAYITRNFDISFMPGDTTYLVGNQATLGQKQVHPYDNSDGDNQYSNLRGHLSIWDDLRQTLKQLKSPQGSIYVSQSATTVTVRDVPDRVEAIANYLRNLNNKLSREVALQVQVLEITLNNGYNYGIDWNIVRKVMEAQVGLTGRLARPVMLPSLGDNNTMGQAGFIIRSMEGVWSGTDLLINALSQQGQVATVTRPRVVTLNNQVAQIDINQQTGYLREVTSTTTGASPATVTSLTPGTVKTGFTLYLLPKIQKHSVYLQMSSTISNLEGIKTITANPNQSAINNSQIQLPMIMEKHFNQRTLVPDNATLVLAGYKQVHNEANRTRMFESDALGSQGAKLNNTETVVLITPVILNR